MSVIREPFNEPLPRRVHVIGTSGSGKTTFARALATQLGVVHVELDDVAWGPEWQLRPKEAVREDLRRLLALHEHTGWVVDGNYSHLRDEVIWPAQPTVVWLDYSFATVMRRVTWRTLRRVVIRKRLWQAGNRESLRRTLFSRDSILLWAATTYRKRRREYPTLLAQHPELPVLRFRRPREAKRWLDSLAPRNAEVGACVERT